MLKVLLTNGVGDFDKKELTMAKQQDLCIDCARTGILSATIIKNNITFKNEKIIVRPCRNHSTSALTDKNLKALAATGIPIEVVEAEAAKS
jgi:hypothetical protein